MSKSTKESRKQQYRQDVLQLIELFPDKNPEHMYNVYMATSTTPNKFLDRAIDKLFEEVDEKPKKEAKKEVEQDEDDYYQNDSDEEVIELDIEDETTPIDNYTEDFEPAESKQDAWRVLTNEQLLEEQQMDVDKVQSILQFKDTNDMYTLLKHYKWNTEKLLSDYVTLGRDEMLRVAGIVLDIEAEDSNSRSCEACMDDDCDDMIRYPACGHSFCRTCWKGYIKTKVEDGFMTQNNITCMGYKCKAVLNEGFVETFATDKEKTTQHTETDDRYLQNRMLSYVTNHHVIKYCPSIPHCGLAIRLNSDTESMSLSEVKCQCGHKFCFGCLQAPHQPATCEMIKKWMKQMREDNANLAWVEEMCKQCPGCGFPIEKNGGCDHMHCKSCNLSFSWSSVTPMKTMNKLMRRTYAEFDPIAVNKFFKATLRAGHHTKFIEHDFSRFRGLLLNLTIDLEKDLNLDLQPGSLNFILKLMSKLSKAKQFLVNCYCYSFYAFELEKVTLELRKKNKFIKSMMTKTDEKKITEEKEDKKSKKLSRKKEKQVIAESKDERLSNAATIELYSNLFDNHVELLEESVQSIMLEINAFKRYFEDLSDDDTPSQKREYISKTRNRLLALVSAVEKQKEGLLDVISKREMKEYDITIQTKRRK